MGTLTYVGSLQITSCWCGIQLAIPSDLYNYAQRKGTAVFCPLGHEFVYGDTQYKRLQKEAEDARRGQELAQQALVRERARSDQARAEAEHQKRRAAAAKGQLTKAKKRAAAGVCPAPDCKRSFQNVARHVARMHPELSHDHDD